MRPQLRRPLATFALVLIDESDDSSMAHASFEPREPAAMTEILVVDDDIIVAEAIEFVLKMEGFKSRWARDGQQAMEFLEGPEEKPVLILLDLKMPRLTGWDVLEKLEAHQELASIPVVVLSAERSPGKLPHARALLRKPFQLSDLLAVIQEVLPARAVAVR